MARGAIIGETSYQGVEMSTIQAFTDFVNDIENQEGYQPPTCFALGIRRRRSDTVLDVMFPHIFSQEEHQIAAVVQRITGQSGTDNVCKSFSQAQLDDMMVYLIPYLETQSDQQFSNCVRAMFEAKKTGNPYAESEIVAYFLFDKDSKVKTPEEAYFKLQLLSHRIFKPHDIGLEGLFGALNNVAWTSHGPMLPEDVAVERINYQFTSTPLNVSHVDKFPYLVNYHIPSGVRIASGCQVRLGAYLGEGTTVMPAGYVNFNAGTEGQAMIEGRVSAGVVVGAETDIGGGASIMGTLSGGNKNVISIGPKCLLGANSGAGISLGFGCTIAAGLYVYAGMKVSLLDGDGQPIDLEGNRVEDGENVFKAQALSGRDTLLFIQDSLTGKVICKPNPKTIELNKELHA
ncbi:MAG: 2,3,4,5-tetrahydropyridine-2-carboxylate N-succinyltransferase [Candidatus Marinamargulisbacteria bacterium]